MHRLWTCKNETEKVKGRFTLRNYSVGRARCMLLGKEAVVESGRLSRARVSELREGGARVRGPRSTAGGGRRTGAQAPVGKGLQGSSRQLSQEDQLSRPASSLVGELGFGGTAPNQTGKRHSLWLRANTCFLPGAWVVVCARWRMPT